MLDSDYAPVDPGPPKDATGIPRTDDSDPATLVDRAIALHQSGRLADAESIYLAILQGQPDDFDAMHLLGVIRHQEGRDHEALELIGSVLRRNPRSASALSNLGAVLHKLKRYQEALEAYDRALAVRVDDASAWYNRGIALKELDRPDEALKSYDQALALNPDFPDALFNRGALLVELRRFDAAIASYQRALEIEPHHRLAFTGLLDSALHVCDWARAAEIAERLPAHIVERQSAVEPFGLLGISDDPALHLQCASNFIRDKIDVPPQPSSADMRWCHERIRIAYLSADFHRHATAYLMAELFELHDRSRFEVIGVSVGPDDSSDMRARLVAAFDQFHGVQSQSDREVARLLRELEIDIAIDLKGYTGGCRPGILAHRPAPIQVSYLGYPGTMGADFIDYVIADPVVLPFDQQPFYTEKIVHLPECYQVNDRQRKIAARTPTREEAGLPDKGFVFCCFNNNYKISASVFDVWMRLLAAVENGVLWLLGDNPAAADNLRKAAAARGIDPARLVFADRKPLPEHLARYRLADLFLDTLPYNAHTTASDALWAGLPVLTCRGRAFGGRVAASLLTAIGLPELVTDSLEAYEALALRLATEPARLRQLRAELADNRLTHPLFDAGRFCRHIEAAYTRMWELWQRGESPQSFSIEPQQEMAPAAPGGWRSPDNGDASGVLNQAIAHHQNGRLAEAERLYLDILEAQPDQFDALHLLGVIRHQQGRDPDALDLIGSALTRKPESAEALSTHGAVLHRLQRNEEALASYDKALSMRPDYPEALFNRGNMLMRLKRLDDALANYDRALAIRPDYPEALLNRGVVLMGLERLDDALASFDRALTIQPDYVEVLSNRGNVLRKLKRFEEALASCDRALTLRADSVEALYNRGIVLLESRHFEDALRDIERALAIRPDYADALSSRGSALRELRRFEEALASYDQAIALKPDHPEALNNRGNVLRELSRFDEALASYQQALAVDPAHSHAFSGLLDAALQTCNWSLAAKLAGQLELQVKQGTSIVAPFVLLGMCDDPELHLVGAKKFIRDRTGTEPKRLQRGTVWRHDRIRVAYLSADFHTHATAFLTAELFERHDRGRFEVVGVSFGGDEASEMRARLARAFDQFHDVRAKSDLAVANQLKTLEIDIAVDLKGYTQDSRPVILAHRPTPIQVNYLGYPGTMGADFIDYVIADPITLPFDRQPFYTERIVHLPECYQVNDSKRKIGEHTPTRREAGLPGQGFVFCCFNNNYKITAAVFDVWMQLLRAVENSVLWLIRDNPTAEVNLRKQASASGLDPTRLVFADRQPLEDHLARHRLADLFLDTLPYNAHTTASDALWAGLPMLTCRGKAFAGRVAASLLTAVGLPELVTDTLEDYEALALRLARDTGLLAGLRAKLARNRLTHPLFDTDRFRRHIEAAYTTMWEMWQRGEDPRSFCVELQQDSATRAPAGRPAVEKDAPRATAVALRAGRERPEKRKGKGRRASRLANNGDQSGVLDQAIALHQKDRLAEAERLYLEILEAQPDQFDALHLLGLIRHQQGRDAEALDLIGSALKLNPRAASALSNQGAVLQRLGRYEEALASYEKALLLQPNDAQAVYNRGTVLERLGRIEEALASYDQALVIRPDNPEALYDRGNVLMALKRLDQALASYDDALAVKPDYVDAFDSRGCVLLALKRPEDALQSFDQALSLRPDFAAAAYNRGNALRELKRLDEAVASYDRALEIQPDYPLALNNRGNVLLELRRHEDALASYDRALAMHPDYVEALSNRGCALKELGRPVDALASYDRALAIRPDYPDAVNNRGNALLDLGRLDEALTSYDRSVELDDQNAQYRFNRSLLLLLLGSFDLGWREYEWRRRRANWGEREFNTPEWAGEPIPGKRLLLYSEQGLGDTIQFARFARSATMSGAQVILDVQASLGGLLRRLDGEATIVRRGEQLPEFDFHLPLVSLPFVLGLIPQQHPAETPYLSADPVRVDLWSSRLPDNGLRVGIAWQGNRLLPTDKGRSIPLEAFAPLAQIPGVTLISLQKGDGVEQMVDLPSGMVVETLGADFDAGPEAFVDTAAVMMNLDLIISCDTAVAHLAGALGCPVWILLRDVPDWRWMLGREDTPWYPTARLFRQTRRGDWEGALNAAAEALRQLAENPRARSWGRYDPQAVIARDTADALYSRGNILKEWGRREEALASYDRVLAIEPDHVEALNRRGMLLWELKRFNEALASYDRALAIRADDAEALNNRGNALWSLRRFDEALKNYDQALAVRPNYPEALYNRASALLELKRLDEALASYDEALQIQPRYAEALYGRGVILMQLGQLEDAVESYNRALAIRPDYPEALNNCGTALTKLGRLDDAVAMYTRALAVRPDDVVVRINRANALRRLGRLDDALENADRAVAIQPDFAAAAYSRGVALQEMRRLDEALVSYERAIALKPDYAEALFRHGIILAALGRLDEAIASWDQALAIRPDYAEALNSRGNALKELERFDEAVASYDRALEIQPDNPWVLNNRGNAFLKSRQYKEALASYDRALTIRPDYVEALSNRACALDELGRPEEALAGFERALALRPDYTDALYNRGNLLVELRRYEEALASYDRALAIRPDYIEALSNRGCALKELGRPEEALASYDRALAIRPDYADAVNNRGCALLDLRRFEEALASYDRSIDLDPQHAEYHNNRSLLLLLLGSFDEGWREYEWRRGRTNWVKRQFNAPEWAGEAVSGKRLLLYSEQGLGDTIQFARFARFLKLSGAQVILEVQPPLRGLLQRLEGEAVIVQQGETLPAFDLHLPLMSVPFVLASTPQQSSAERPYLSADPERVELWSNRLPARGFRVGIAWQGNPKNLTDQQRSLPLMAFTPLGRIPGMRLVSLQKASGVEQLTDLPSGMVVEILGPDFDVGPDAFVDTAAVMMNLDLVITCDTAVAHLAGALGRPVWILLKQVPDWRWMLDREESSWYPTARLFRQTRAGDWDEVITRVAAALAPLAANAPRHPVPEPAETLSAPLSFGELIDKITILRIKSERITDPEKLANVRRELELLTDARLRSPCNQHEIGELERELERVNQELWDIEDRIRDCERQADFGSGFIDLARAVYKTNDRRAAIKRRINEIADSQLIEEKSYCPSQPVDVEAAATPTEAETAEPAEPAPPAPQIVDFSRLLDRAVALHQQDKLAEAEPLYLTILAAQPDHPDATHLLGLVRHQQGRDLEALELIGAVLKRTPDAAAAWGNHGVVLHKVGRREEAVASYNRALALRPEDAKALCNRGLVLQELGRPQEALASYDRALALHPGYPEALKNRNNALRLLAASPSPEHAVARISPFDNHIIFDWQISSFTGWGLYGLNLLLSWSKLYGPMLLTSIGFNEADLALNALEKARLRSALEQSRALQAWLQTVADGRVDVPTPVLHPLGNNMISNASKRRIQLSGKPSLGVIFFESTKFSQQAREQAKSFDLLIAGSTWNCEILEQMGLGPGALVLQGIDPSHFHPGPRAGLFHDRFTVFSGGKLEFRKAQDLVLLAFRAFAKRHPEALLVTAWSSPWPQFARKLEVNPAIRPVCFRQDGRVDAKAWAVANGLNPEQVLDLGAVPNAELPRLYREMDVALFPNRCEGGTNLVAMECMGCGVPLVISSNTGHLDLIAADHCIPLQRQAVVPGEDHLGWGESDIEEIVEALETVWRDRAAARSLGSRGAEFTSRLTWDETTRRMAEVLQQYVKLQLPHCQSHDVHDVVRAGARQGLNGVRRVRPRSAPTLPMITIVTTCKGRLAFLRQTLPRMVNTRLSVIAVDFDCPQGTADFVKSTYPTVHVIAVKDQPVWNLAKARNIGAQSADGDFLLFVDSDVIVHDAFVDFIGDHELRQDEFYHGLGNPDLCGQSLIPRRRFEEIGGYDEAIVGWGFEDEDLYARLRLKGARQLGFGPGLFEALPHPDALRTEFNPDTRKWSNQRINSIYSKVKIDLESATQSSLTLEERRKLRREIEMLILRAATLYPEAISFEIPRGKLAYNAPAEARFELDRALKYSLSGITAPPVLRSTKGLA